MAKTKIVATLGPASNSAESIEALLRAGADVFRLNFSHGTEEEHRRTLQAVREACARTGLDAALLGDLPGPKIRLGRLDPSPLMLREGQRFFLAAGEFAGSAEGAAIAYPHLARDIAAGDHIALNDGMALLRVVENRAGRLECVVESPGEIATGKGVNFPGARLSVPGLTQADLRWIRFAAAERLDMLALSFVREPGDLRAARRAMQQAGAAMPLLAKIEKHEAVEALEAILAEADGAMAARGDLGVEMPLEETPGVQKRLIRLCNRAAKPVITATQMLESMIHSRRPTRAEVSDVANAIFDGTDAVMLSAETAIGRYPAEAVRTMDQVALAAERDLPEREAFAALADIGAHSSDEAIAASAVHIAGTIGAASILCCTTSGSTARRVARYRPRIPLAAFTQRPETACQLRLTWGVRTLIDAAGAAGPRAGDGVEAMLERAAAALRREGLVPRGARIVATAGAPLHVPGATNLIRVMDL